jgi:hypothetical protein
MKANFTFFFSRLSWANGRQVRDRNYVSSRFLFDVLQLPTESFERFCRGWRALRLCARGSDFVAAQPRCGVVIGGANQQAVEHLVCLAFEKSLRVNGSHTAGTSSGHRLAVNVVLHVAARENTRNARLRPVVSYDVARGI